MIFKLCICFQALLLMIFRHLVHFKLNKVLGFYTFSIKDKLRTIKSILGGKICFIGDIIELCRALSFKTLILMLRELGENN